MTEKQPFIITSYGIAATTWLAATLSMHPKIFCAHHVTHPPREAVKKDASLEVFFQKRGLDTAWLEKVDVCQFMHDHSAVTEKPFVGNVHAFKIDTLLPRLVGEAAKIPVVNLTRHPITRIESIARHRKKHGDYDPKMRGLVEMWWEEEQEALRPLIEKYAIDVSVEENRLFLLAARSWLKFFRQDEAAYRAGIPQVRYEDVTTRPETLAELIRYVTKGQVEADADYLAKAYADRMRINHNREEPLDAHAQYTQWEPWQKAAFHAVLDEIGEERVAKVYNALQYDFSFLEIPLTKITPRNTPAPASPQARRPS